MTSDASVLTLSVTDSPDGRVREVPLRFVREGDRWYVLAPAAPLPRWFAPTLAALRVRWQVGDEVFEGAAAPSEDPAAIRARFESSFGPGRVAQWVGAEAVALALAAEGPPAVGYEAQVERYFDRAAADYDRLVQGNPFDRYLRTASLDLLRRSFRPGDRVLEIGCGTGLETLPLAAAGVEVVATDTSAAMLERLQAKASAAGLSGLVRIHKLRARDLGELEREYGAEAFQGAFSTFGALNCEPAWRRLPPVLVRLLRPRATLVLGVWNRTCLVELAAYGLAGRPRRALARLRSPAPVGLTRFGIPVYASSVGEYVRAFRPGFAVGAVLGLPVLLPPYDLGGRVPNPEVFLPLLAAADAGLRGRFPFNRLGDHFILVLHRRPGDGPK